MTSVTTSQFCQTERHKMHFLSCGPEAGTPIIFLHGWPELSYSWREQLPYFASLGFRAIAPDMRGYGKSTVYDFHEAYAQSEIVKDMLDLLEFLDIDRAIWVGHDWGCATAWSMASHHPEKTIGVANLCVPYAVLENGLDTLVALIDRSVYPLDRYPAGQWDYQYFYLENFERATEVFANNPRNTLIALFRGGGSEGVGQPAITADIRRQGGWFGPLDEAPPMPLDTGVLSEADLEVYVESLSRNGFYGPDSYYMNHERNAEFAKNAKHNGLLSMPVLFLAAKYDFVCETVDSRLAEPMREKCSDLKEVVIECGHWMAQEQPQAVNVALQEWIDAKLKNN